jgi:hypothetical protein
VRESPRRSHAGRPRRSPAHPCGVRNCDGHPENDARMIISSEHTLALRCSPLHYPLAASRRLPRTHCLPLTPYLSRRAAAIPAECVRPCDSSQPNARISS